jgi:hypothetical protein
MAAPAEWPNKAMLTNAQTRMYLTSFVVFAVDCLVKKEITSGATDKQVIHDLRQRICAMQVVTMGADSVAFKVWSQLSDPVR